MNNTSRTLAGMAIICLCAFPLLLKRYNEKPVYAFSTEESCSRHSPGHSEVSLYKSRNVHKPGLTRQTHASALAVLPEGRLLATWYGGSREGSKDSAIFTADYSPATGSWGEARIVANRVTTGMATRRYVKKVGNPVLKLDSDGTLHLFYVSVSVGGWSGSAINHMTSTDLGSNWSAPKRLISSPFFNLSTLVKGEPLLMADGAIAIPVYHELMGKFGEILLLHPVRGVFDKTRISYGRASLQPSVAVFDKKTAVAMLRYAGDGNRRVQYSHTEDGGQSWSAMTASSLPNPNAAVSVRCIDNNTLLMAFNNTSKGRYDLSLAISKDMGKNWRTLHKIEYAPAAETEQRFSYPYMIEDGNGTFHISYTWNKQVIKHLSFNRSWLKEKMQ